MKLNKKPYFGRIAAIFARNQANCDIRLEDENDGHDQQTFSQCVQNGGKLVEKIDDE